jgi:carbon monoxide dehydrogenase subunit G
MALEITKTIVIKAPPARVWAFLVDPHSVARCMPGAAITGRIDDRTYGGTMTVKVGPVSSSYRGRVVFERLDPEARTAEIVATGQDVRGKGGADLRLTSRLREVGPAETEVTAVSQVNITGILAQMGRGMVEDVSDQMFQIFSQRMRAELESAVDLAGGPDEARPPRPPLAPGQAHPPALTPAEAQAVAAAVAVPALREVAGPVRAAAPAAAEARAPAARAPEALDLGSLGARVAGRAAVRALKAPTPLWLALLLAAAALLLLRR